MADPWSLQMAVRFGTCVSGGVQSLKPACFFSCTHTLPAKLGDHDVLMFCTGYQYKFPFIDDSVVTVKDNAVTPLCVAARTCLSQHANEDPHTTAAAHGGS